jgi:hypothetical protein
MTRLEELLAEESRLREEYNDAKSRLDEIKQAVLEERFAGVDRFAVGNIILVPRKLFGNEVMWPARVESVTLHHAEGRWSDTYEKDPGGHWESLNISYGVYLQQRDGTYSGSRSSNSFWHHEVARAPEECAQP